ncbi:MAG TPA: OmpA family protein [Halomonas sp.]|nr:OmpA family protein [Halomonas sp.]
MVDDHLGLSRYDSLLEPVFDEESGSGWMISYMDIMTLLVALFVVMIASSRSVDLDLLSASIADTSSAYQLAPAPRFTVPLPDALKSPLPDDRPQAMAAPSLTPRAITAALGVAGRPTPRPLATPPLLRMPPAVTNVVDKPSAQPPEALPRLALPSGVDTSRPLANYLLVLTDHLPPGAEAANEQAVAPLSVDTADLDAAPYLPDLQGVEVTRVAEGIKLRVEDRLLFATAEADLTKAGSDLVVGMVELIQRHEGEVSVEGHTDDRPIQTPRFASNWSLSSARAIAIVQSLEHAGVAASRLRAVGLADTRPLADNATAEGRAINRRVEVVIQRE